MEAFTMLFVIILAILIYVGYCWIISSAVKSTDINKHNPFWWVFFFNLIGAIICVLLDIRDK
jgi:lipopolysaccharide export LptBFGC system permease protein LptF